MIILIILIKSILLSTCLLCEAVLFWIPFLSVIFSPINTFCVQHKPEGAARVKVQRLYPVQVAPHIYFFLFICSVNIIIIEWISWHLQRFPLFLSLRGLSTLHTAVELTGAWVSVVISCSLTAASWSSPWTIMPCCLVGWITLFWECLAAVVQSVFLPG